MLNDEGKATTKTAPRSSQQNGLVERRFRTLFDAVRTTLAHSKLGQVCWPFAALEAISNGIYRRSTDSFTVQSTTASQTAPTPQESSASGSRASRRSQTPESTSYLPKSRQSATSGPSPPENNSSSSPVASSASSWRPSFASGPTTRHPSRHSTSPQPKHTMSRRIKLPNNHR